MKHFNTPVGVFTITVNGELIDIVPVPEKLGMWIDNKTELFADELYRINIDFNQFKKGDIIVGRIAGAPMELDSGDEHLINMVGQNNEYTYGIGTIDNNDCCYENDERREIPFQLLNVLSDGLKVIVDGDTHDYSSLSEIWQPHFQIAWKKEVSENAWNLISFITC